MGSWRPMLPCPFCGATVQSVPGGPPLALKIVHREDCPVAFSRPLCCCSWKSKDPNPDCSVHGNGVREFCPNCGERLDIDAEGACGECGWIPSRYDDGSEVEA